MLSFHNNKLLCYAVSAAGAASAAASTATALSAGFAILARMSSGVPPAANIFSNSTTFETPENEEKKETLVMEITYSSKG